MITYRKTRDGKWVVCGPVSEVKVGQVTVTKKSGSSTQETVLSLGKPFSTPQGQMVYGYLAEKRSSNGSGSDSSSSSSRKRSRDWPGKECPCCGSEPLNSHLYCWECGYQGQG